MREKSQKRKLCRNADQRNRIRHGGKFQTLGDGKDDGGEDQTNGVIHKEGGKNAGSKNEQYQKLPGAAGQSGNMDGHPVKKSGDSKVSDKNHDTQQKNNGVPIHGLIRGIQGEY